MTFLENKVPPLLVVGICGLLMWGLAYGVDRPGLTFFSVALILSLLVIGTFFCMAGVVSFRLARTTVNPMLPERATTLVNSGIYRVSRNPMYVGFAFILGAWSVFLASLLSVVGIVVFILYMNRFQIIPEERVLLKLFGDDFTRYRLAVRRWL